MRARNELAQRWRSLLSLALIAGLGSAVVLASLAGARRTESAYPRFLAATHAYNVLLSDDRSQTSQPGHGPTQEEQIALLRRLQSAHLPAIVDSTIVELYSVDVVAPNGKDAQFPDVFPVADDSGKMATQINVAKIIRGRRADPAKADEAVTNPTVAERLGLQVNSVLTFRMQTPNGALITQPIRIVGIAEVAGQVDPSSGGFIPAILLTPAFWNERLFDPSRQDPVLMTVVKGGDRELPELYKEIASTHLPVSTNILQSPQTVGLLRSSKFEVVGLDLFAALAALTILAVFGQLLVRQIFLESDEHEWLNALGMTRGQLVAITLVRVGVVALAAAVIAVVGAFLLSPIAPFGPMRPLETSPGLRFDASVLGFGFLGTIAVVLALAALPAWVTSSFAKRRRDSELRANAAANAAARASFSPAAVTGIHLALEPGRGKTAVPIRTAIFGTTLAIAALMAALSFGSGLTRLIASPSLSGWNFDAIVGDDLHHLDALQRQLTADGTISASVRGALPDILVRGVRVSSFAMEEGSFGVSIASGRLPRGPGEIALGPKLLHDLKTTVGKTVPVVLLDQNTLAPLNKALPLRIVGIVVTPQFFFTGANPGEGAAISFDFVHSVAPTVQDDGMWVRFRPGLDLDSGVAKIRALGSPENNFVVARTKSSDLQNLQRVSNLPGILAGLLGLLGAATLVHTLATSVRRRRKDLAVLKTLGFVRGQVRAAVAWQTTTLIVIALAVGLPLGAVAGRLGWRVFVDTLGFVPRPVVPLIAMFITIPAALLLANTIASFPARAAARTQPAVALRAE